MTTDKLSFTRDATAVTKQQIAARCRALRGPIPRDIYLAANADLAREAKALAFSTKRDYAECVKHLTTSDAWLGLGIQLHLDGADSDRALAELGIEVPR